MKTILLLLVTLLNLQQPAKLTGVYKLQYDNKYQLQSCLVTFNDSVYTKKLPDGLTSKGKILYAKYKITLKPDNNDNPIEIDGREIANDTVKFTTKSKTDLSMNVNRGRMIRSK